MLKWALIGLVVFLIYRYAKTRPRYEKIFSAAHLMELDRGLLRSRVAAMERVGQRALGLPFAEGTAFVTSADIAVFYTISTNEKDGFEHHVSLSYRGGFLATAAGAFLAAAIRRLLDVTHQECALARSSRGVFHFIFSLSAEAQARFANAKRTPLDEETARRLIDVALDDRPGLIERMGKIEVDVERMEQKK